MKFICDQMLARFGRWLRAAGYDTVIIEESLEDSEIFRQAVQENRLLITRDRGIQELDLDRQHVRWLQSNSTEECVRELSQQLPVNWLLKPFSRCLVCNGLLVETDNPDMQQVPEDIQTHCQQFWGCPECGKVYWEGSHTKRMRKQLEQWQRIGNNPL